MEHDVGNLAKQRPGHTKRPKPELTSELTSAGDVVELVVHSLQCVQIETRVGSWQLPPFPQAAEVVCGLWKVERAKVIREICSTYQRNLGPSPAADRIWPFLHTLKVSPGNLDVVRTWPVSSTSICPVDERVGKVQEIPSPPGRGNSHTFTKKAWNFKGIALHLQRLLQRCLASFRRLAVRTNHHLLPPFSATGLHHRSSPATRWCFPIYYGRALRCPMDPNSRQLVRLAMAKSCQPSHGRVFYSLR